jgi:hypothetical protein
MKYVDCTTLYLPYLCKIMGYFPTPFAQCMTCVDETGKPLAGVVFDAYNGKTISAHIWVGNVPSKEWYAAIFDYPFNRLGVTRILGQVAGSNVKAQRLDEHFGFVESARIPDYSDDGDLIMYTMTKAQCRVLNSPAWKRTLNIVEAA